MQKKSQMARAHMYRLLKSPLLSKFDVDWKWPVGVDACSWERVTIPSRSGAELAGLYGTTDALVPKGVVVCAHPMRRCAKGFFLESGRAEMLLRNGYDVLLFDFNGFGESPNGDFRYPYDVLAAGGYAHARAKGRPVHAFALSFGSGWAICAATQQHPFSSIILEGPFTRIQDYYRGSPGAKAVVSVLSKMFSHSAEMLTPIEAVRYIAGKPKMLFIGATQDTTTPSWMTRQLFRACSVPRSDKQEWFVRNAGHIRGFESAPELYEHRVIRFLDAASALKVERDTIVVVRAG